MNLVRTGRLAALTLVLAVTAGTMIAAPAEGTAAARPPELQLLDASRTWVVYAVDEHVFVKPTDGGKPVRINGYSDSIGQEIAGDLLVYTTPQALNSDQRYLNLRTGVKGKVPARWDTVTPDGGAWAAVDEQDGKIHGYDQNVTSGMVTDLGPLPGFVRAKHVSSGAVYADERGIVFENGSDDTDRGRADYVTFRRPGHVTRLDMTGVSSRATCSLANNALGCANDYLDRGSALHDKSTVVRVPLDGSAQQTIHVTIPKLPKRAHPYIDPAVTSARTAWTFGLDSVDSYGGPTPSFSLHSVAASAPGGHRTSSDFNVGDPSFLVTGGNRIYVAHDSRAKSAGIYRVVDHGRKQKLFLHV